MLKEYSSENESVAKYGLTSLKKIEKNELVAIFSNDVEPELHYIRNSDIPNCYLDGKRVFTRECVQPLSELTIKYA